MKKSQFYALQSSIFIVASLAATLPLAKAAFLILSGVYLIMQFGAYKSEL